MVYGTHILIVFIPILRPRWGLFFTVQFAIIQHLAKITTWPPNGKPLSDQIVVSLLAHIRVTCSNEINRFIVLCHFMELIDAPCCVRAVDEIIMVSGLSHLPLLLNTCITWRGVQRILSRSPEIKVVNRWQTPQRQWITLSDTPM